jgi:hypothetical protein
VNYIIGIIPRHIGEIMGYIIILLFVSDFTMTVINTVKFDHILAKLHSLRQDMAEYIGSAKIYETSEELLAKFSNLRMLGLFSEMKSSFEEWLHNPKTIKQSGRLELKKLKPEVEARLKEFLGRYQSIRTQKAHIRLLKAFPTMKVGKREEALKDLREKIGRKGVLELGKDIRDEVTGTIKGYLSGFLRAALVGLLVLAQFVMIIYLSIVLRENTIYLYTGIQVLSIIIVIGLSMITGMLLIKSVGSVSLRHSRLPAISCLCFGATGEEGTLIKGFWKNSRGVHSFMNIIRRW